MRSWLIRLSKQAQAYLIPLLIIVSVHILIVVRIATRVNPILHSSKPVGIEGVATTAVMLLPATLLKPLETLPVRSELNQTNTVLSSKTSQSSLVRLEMTQSSRLKQAKKAIQTLVEQALQAEEEGVTSVRQHHEIKAKSQQVKASDVLHSEQKEKIAVWQQRMITAISQYWRVPSHLVEGVQATLRVMLSPEGKVLEVKVIKSSGYTVLDHSAERAVYNASPLPMPQEPELKIHFQELNITVRPEVS